MCSTGWGQLRRSRIRRWRLLGVIGASHGPDILNSPSLIFIVLNSSSTLSLYASFVFLVLDLIIQLSSSSRTQIILSKGSTLSLYVWMAVSRKPRFRVGVNLFHCMWNNVLQADIHVVGNDVSSGINRIRRVGEKVPISQCSCNSHEVTKQRHQSNHELLKCLVWQVSGTVNILEANEWLDIVVKKNVKRNKVQNAHAESTHTISARNTATTKTWVTTWQACQYKVHELHQRLRSLLLYLCYVFQALINSLVCWHCS